MTKQRTIRPRALACATGTAVVVTLASAAAAADLLRDVRQLTFAGQRAGEGYFSADGSRLVFQSERETGNPFFQIYVLDLETGDTEMVSTGTGKTTCAWLHPDGETVLFASTHNDPEAAAKQAAELADREAGEEKRYSWDYDEHYEIYSRRGADGELVNLTNTRGYDAEGSYSPDGGWIVFASNRQAYDGSMARDAWAKFKLDPAWAMDLYRMRADGSGVGRLTDAPGYDGGPFFNHDGTKICWRRFSEDGATAEIWTMGADGSDPVQLTRLEAMSWAPFFHPSGEYLIFATNLHGFANFELYLVDASGRGDPVRVTDSDGFDGLPAFSPDGTKLAWTSNRTANNKSQIFLADWDHDAALAALAGEAGAPPVAAAPADRVEGNPEIAREDLERHINHLASARMQGRLTGTEGEQLATKYAAEELAAFGLGPDGGDGTFFQPFEFTAGVALGDGNRLTFGDTELEAGTDWSPLSFSVSGDLGSAGVVFAGYGIEAPAETGPDGEEWSEYSSYAHLDVGGKWVMVFRYMPEGIAPELRQRFARFSSLRFKAMLARERGAKGILVVSGPNAKVKNQLVPLTFDASLAGSGIGAISVTDEVAQSILDAGGAGPHGERLDLGALQTALDGGEMQAGIPLGGAGLAATVSIEQERKTGRNVVARLRGDGSASRVVVIGAHIDHLGKSAGSSSRARDDEADQIHFGADDNASGVAALLEIAQQFAARQREGKLKLKRDVVFAAWSGEELGLLGSAHYVKALAEASGDGEGDGDISEDVVAYLNMDMVGRLDRSLVLQGVGSSDYWLPEIERRNVPVGLPLTTQNDSYLPTDATSFYLKGVPVLSAFTGAHEDYHRPTDTPDKINYEGTVKITKLIGLIARGLATSEAAPEYKPMEKPENVGRRAALRAYLGTIPDYAQGDESGVKLSGVAKGGPSDEAGLRSGDVIVELAGKEVKNIYDYTYVIEALKIGEEVSIVVARDGERVEMKVTPGSRD